MGAVERRATASRTEAPQIAESIESSVSAFASELPAGHRVLDVGCGLRPYEKYFAHGRYVGIDVEESGRRPQGKHVDLYFDGRSIPFEDEAFDAVLCTEVLEHCVDPGGLVEEMYRVLDRHGRLLVTVPFIWGEHEVPFDFRRYSTFGVAQLLGSTKFKIVRLDRLTRGVDAVEMLVASEINNYEVNVAKPLPENAARRARRRFLRAVIRRVWPVQLRLWRELYAFERIYIDNLVIAVKE